MDSVINLTISLIKSNEISESMRSGYVKFLHRYKNQSNSIHEEEISLIKQEAKKLKIEIVEYGEKELQDVLKTYQVHKSRNSYSYSENARNKKQSVNTKSNSEESEIEKLNEIIQDLKQKGKQAVASRDKWRNRAEIAEKRQNEQSQNNDKKFKQVKKEFSKMYHPDSLTGANFEKLIKQEIFKEFWQVIENIEKNSTYRDRDT